LKNRLLKILLGKE